MEPAGSKRSGKSPDKWSDYIIPSISGCPVLQDPHLRWTRFYGPDSGPCVRFYYVRQLANEPELYQQLAYSLVWHALELYVAIFCGCSSALKVFFKRQFPALALLGSSSSRTGYPLDSRRNNGTKTRTSHPLTDLSDRRPGNHTVISSGGRGGRVATNTRDSSKNDSEEAIILGEHGIQKQTEIQVTQETARMSSDSEGRRPRSGSHDRPKARSFVV